MSRLRGDLDKLAEDANPLVKFYHDIKSAELDVAHAINEEFGIHWRPTKKTTKKPNQPRSDSGIKRGPQKRTKEKQNMAKEDFDAPDTKKNSSSNNNNKNNKKNVNNNIHRSISTGLHGMSSLH